MNLDPDLFFVLGTFFGLLSFPALLNAFTHGRRPGMAVLMFVIAGAMIAFAVSQKPSGSYTAKTIPGVFVRVFGGGPG
ncbi:hypothetical protein [Tropicimonas aquimaris]|uniref:Uncharacterized protein n=1 Tax=Tropicimonas aquimaris TaxID=914152 RepID=A0ABW3ISG3_9RHOB